MAWWSWITFSELGHSWVQIRGISETAHSRAERWLRGSQGTVTGEQEHLPARSALPALALLFVGLWGLSHPGTRTLIVATCTGFFFFKKLFICIAVYPINSAMIVSGEEQRDAATHIHVPILPQAPLPPRLPQDNEQRSMCHTVGRGWLSILNTAVCSRWSRTVPSPHSFPPYPDNHKFVI